MKVAFITVHVGENFGSILQAIATSVFIKRTGNEPLLINYIPKRVSKSHYWKTAFKSPVRFLWRILRAPLFYKNHYIYDNYCAKYCLESVPIYDSDDFLEKCPKADIYLTGSDQVWNSLHNQGLNKRYYFDGLDGKKISFASSFGVEKLKDDEYNEVSRMLGAYSSISVREKSGRKIVESMGYKATLLLDPTFMLNKSEWKQYMSDRIVSSPYLLVYIPYNIADKKLIYSVAHKIAKNRNLKIVTFSWGYFNDSSADITIRFASPGDFLSLMEYADFVITNSFHGTAFSINLHKQFGVFMPTSFSTRISSILEKCGLENRLIDGDKDVIMCDFLQSIDYEKIDNILDEERKTSFDFLQTAIYN